MQLTLPIGYDSWTQVLTDWSVVRAYDVSPCPACFSRHPELAAPFVAEIGAAVREKKIRRRGQELAIHRESATEPAYDQAGGPAYFDLRDTMQVSQTRYFRVRRGADPRTLDVLRAELDRLQGAFLACRRRSVDFVHQARLRAVRDFWTAHPPCGLPDNFFADAPVHSAATRMSQVEPAWWWREFFTHLQLQFANRHSADGCFLDVLPQLRTQARKKTLAAVIAEWSEERADEWGWAGPGHYRMLVIRANKKAHNLVDWFNQRAPGYLAAPDARHSLHALLREQLAEKDSAPILGAHWRN